MANVFQQAGASLGEPTNFAPLLTNRIMSGLWTNRSFLRDAATTAAEELYGLTRQDSIWDGQNSEISPRLTLIRRPGASVYNSWPIGPVTRFYSFNTFNLAQENIRVLADTPTQVLDITGGQQPVGIWQKSTGAKQTFFLGVGNNLYFTNGVENKQWQFDPETGTGVLANWGIQAPVNAPIVGQQPRPLGNYGRWNPNTIYAAWVNTSSVGAAVQNFWNMVVIQGSDDMLHSWGTTNGAAVMSGMLGAVEPTWSTSGPDLDGTIEWQNRGNGAWQASYGHGIGDLCIGLIPVSSGTDFFLFVTVQEGQGGAIQPQWQGAPQVGMQVQDGQAIWQNVGRLLKWANIAVDAGALGGLSNAITTQSQIVDSNGYLQTVYQMGVSSPQTSIDLSTTLYALTTDNLIIWQNTGDFAAAGSAGVSYGYEYMNSSTNDLSNMSPQSNPIILIQGNEAVVIGEGSADPQVDKIVIFRTAQGGSSFLQIATIDNPGAGQQWTWTDETTDADLNTEWQAQMSGEGTPLPVGATCLEYHMGRIWAAVGNVVYGSAGPDAVVGGSSGKAGFNTMFTVQSKVTRLWACSQGLVVFTVRDAYIILGSGVTGTSTVQADPFYIVVFAQDLPLRSYDCFTVNKTTAILLLGNNMLVSLDPGAGITELGFPIADRFREEFDSSASFVTYHSQSSMDTALYVGNGVDRWYRMSIMIAPEQGYVWSPRAIFAGGVGCIQSIEINPGEYRLLIGGNTPGPVLQRDYSTNADDGVPYSAYTVFGAIILAAPGQLAGLHFFTLESAKVGTRPQLAVLLGEQDGEFETLCRTRQDPTNLPPSDTVYSDRYHFKQNQKAAWCRYFQMEIDWAAEDVPSELFTFTIFGQMWQEMVSQ